MCLESFKSLNMAHGEWVRTVDVCEGEHNGSTRIFYTKFTTSHGRTLSGGTWNNRCHHFHFDGSKHVLGMYGKSGREIDRIRFVYKTFFQDMKEEWNHENVRQFLPRIA